MQYPLYEFYLKSDLSLEEIQKHYTEHFYLKTHGRDKAEKVLAKVSASNKMNELFETSLRRRVAPNYIDFGSVINGIMWFMFQSNSTQALAVLSAATAWNRKVNCIANLKSDKDLRDDTIKIFKKFSVYEDMTQKEFEDMTQHPVRMKNEGDDGHNYKSHLKTDVGSYHILNFYLDCYHWHKQEDEIKRCPLSLPVQIIDVDKEDDIVDKYQVVNLPTLVLVDGHGKELHRWVGVTPTLEINQYLYDNGYTKQKPNKMNDIDSIPGLPPAIKEKLKDPQIMDQFVAILAEGGSEAQVKEKIDYLLGLKKKPDSTRDMERKIRSYIRRQFDIVGGEVLPEDGRYDDILTKMYATKRLSQLNNELDDNKYSPEVAKYKEMASKNGISWYGIKFEEMKRALSIYRDGKSDYDDNF